MTRAFIGLGSNLDDPPAQIAQALSAIGRIPHTELVRHSRLYRSPAWGNVEQPDFANAIAEIATQRMPLQLLSDLLAIEKRQGRVRDGSRWGPRRIDLDLLVHGTEQIDQADLVLPHPRIAERAFVLVPLAEIAPDLDIPRHGNVNRLLAGIDIAGCIAFDNVSWDPD